MEENKKYFSQGGAAGAVIIFFVLLFVFAKWGPAINFATTSQSKGEPFVVSGEGKVSVTPDIAKVSLGVQESGSSLKSVQNSVNTKAKALTSKLQSLGISQNDIKTTSYNVYPQYDFSGSTQKITGYQVSTDYLPKEKAALISRIAKGGEINIVAKSVGSLVAAYIIEEIPNQINKVIICGIPLNDLNEAEKDAIKLALGSLPPEKIICFQNDDDPHATYADVSEFLPVGVNLISKPRSDHEYPYFDEFNRFLSP